MKYNKILKLIKIIYFFKNPFVVIKFVRGNFEKGKPVIIKPRKNQPFLVSRYGDRWLIDKIINKGKVKLYFDPNDKQKYIIENNILLRQGTSDTFVFKEIFIDECYKKSISELNKNSIVIDIGSHIGLFSLYCSPKCNIVYSYEAHIENYNLAIKNIKRNNIINIKPNNLAVWSKSGEKVNISDSEGSQTGEHTIKLNNDFNEKNFLVKTISLQDIFLNNNLKYCDLLKIDIEGAEYEVLFSVPDEIYGKINSIYIEYHPDLKNKKNKEDLIGFLENKKYILEVNKINDLVGLIYARK